ncbi:MAG: complex I NDUFA9 subunit family protein [Gammaproteobacteria bacterium]
MNMAIKGLIGVIGGSGFVGSELCAQLISSGYSVKLLTRNTDKCRHLKVLPSLSIVQIKDYQSNTLTAALKDCHALINLIGILNERGNDGKEFHRIHVGITRNALKACENAKIPRLLQMSALNAHPDAPSHYLRSKGKAENYLKTFSASQVNYTIFQPSVIFGEGDSFLNRFADLLKIVPGIFPLACPNARFAPVYVGDVANKMITAIEDKASYNQSYELCGPNIYSLKELVQYTANICGYKRTVLGLPMFLSKLQATVFEYVPGKPLSKDNFNSLKLDSVCKQCPPCTTSLSAIAPTYLANR